MTPEGQAELRETLARLRAAHDPREQQVAETLAVLTVLGPEGAPDGQVAFGMWVTVRDGEGTLQNWRIVGPDEADPRRGLVSAHAPVGRALLGRETGESVEIDRPGGAWNWRSSRSAAAATKTSTPEVLDARIRRPVRPVWGATRPSRSTGRSR